MVGDGALLMLFDSDCGLCSASAAFVARRTAPTVRLCAMQSPAGQTWLRRLGMDPTAFETFVVIDGDTVLVKSDAALHLAAHMGWPWRISADLARAIPLPWRDRLYDLVARNRYRIVGRREVCALPPRLDV